MLFSDIEGSTRLLNRWGPRYPDILATHRRILRRAFDDHGGRELGTEGDSFFVVFTDAAEAVAAAAQGQRDLASHPWPDGASLRVRMGLHTGTPEHFEDNLVGIDVHVGARVAATAHGGQVVLSAATADSVKDRLPEGSTLVDLGKHRLKDITGEQRLHQLLIPDLPASFPPLRSLGAPSSLPTVTSPIVGRDDEIHEVSALLTTDGQRLVTLLGPGGGGKTRLSIAVAQRVSSSFEAVHFVDLSAATEDHMAWEILGETVGRTKVSVDALLDHLRTQRILLVLDNLEQLPESGRELASRLLGETAAPSLLATSRSPLQVAGEQQYPVAPLGIPRADLRALSVSEAAQAHSVQLFVQRARMADPRFELSDDNVADVVAICRRLDGLPLAIELAAARVRMLPPKALLDHLHEALGLPLPGHPERQQSLPATVDWSYRMVGPAEQLAFRALAAFGNAGGTLEALADVLDVPSALAEVLGLVDVALVRTEDDSAGLRVKLLQPVRAVAHDLAERAGDLAEHQRRHAHHYLRLAERVSDQSRGPDEVAARAAITLEMDNLRSALTWSLADLDQADEDRVGTGIRLCTALGWHWYVTGFSAESERWLERAGRAAAAQQGPELETLLHSFALLLLQRGDYAQARDLLIQTLDIARREGDPSIESRALNSLGVAYRRLGELDQSRVLLRASLELGRSIENLGRQAAALTNLALIEIYEGNPEGALPLLAEAEDLDLARGEGWGVASDRLNQATALLALDRADEAIVLLRGLATSVEEYGDPDLTCAVIEVMAYAASLTGDHRLAVRLAALAEVQRALHAFPLDDLDSGFLERQLAISRAALGEDLEELKAEGRSLSVADGLAEVALLGTA